MTSALRAGEQREMHLSVSKMKEKDKESKLDKDAVTLECNYVKY